MCNNDWKYNGRRESGCGAIVGIVTERGLGHNTLLACCPLIAFHLAAGCCIVCHPPSNSSSIVFHLFHDYRHCMVHQLLSINLSSSSCFRYTHQALTDSSAACCSPVASSSGGRILCCSSRADRQQALSGVDSSQRDPVVQTIIVHPLISFDIKCVNCWSVLLIEKRMIVSECDRTFISTRVPNTH